MALVSCNFMPNNRQNQNNPPPKITWLLAVSLLGLLLYSIAYFNQPSTLGFTNELGNPLPRWFDLSLFVLWDELAAGMTGQGRFEVAILDRLPIAAAGLSWLALAGGIGWPIIARFVCRPALNLCERAALSTLAGLALLSSLTLLIGLAGGLGSRWPLAIASGLLFIALHACHRWLLRQRASPGSTQGNSLDSSSKPQPTTKTATATTTAFCEPRPRSQSGVWAARLLPPAVIGMAMIFLWGSLVTPFEFDVVEYHLQAPKEFWQAGEIRFNAHNVYANMPLGVEMHSLAAMTLVGGPQGWWWGGLIGKFMTGMFAILAALLLGGFVSRWLGSNMGWAAAGLLLSTPGNAQVSMAGLVDSALGAYVLAMIVVWNLLKSTTDHDSLIVGVFLSSLFAGAAAACKYPGLVFAMFPLLAMTARVLASPAARPSMQQKIGIALALCLGLSLTCAPWLIKNAWQTGNPVYPLAASIFGAPGLSPPQIAQWNAAHRVPSHTGSTHGLSAAMAAADQLWLRSAFLGPVLIPLAAIGLLWGCCGSWPTGPGASLFSRGKPQSGDTPNEGAQESMAGNASRPWIFSWLWLGLWILAVWWAATHRIDRFWLPVLPLYAGLAAWGLAAIAWTVSFRLAAALVLFSIAYGGLQATSGALGDNRFFVKLSALRVDAGDDSWPGRMSPATLWINQHLNQPDAKILLIGEARVFDFEPEISYATCFNENIGQILLAGKPGEQQRTNLRSAGITHIMIHWAEIARYRSPGNYGFSDWPQPADIDEMLEQSVVERVDWPIASEQVELLRVLP